jgi:uncharacterized damage-inducible protein DinB
MKAAQLFAHWKTVRRDLLRALDKLEPEHLAFTPREDLRSLAEIIVHIAEAEEGWFHYTVTRELDAWPERPAADYATVPALKALLDDVHARTWAYLDTVDEADLDRVVDLPWDGELPLRWIIWHVLEHEIHHRGEIFLMLGLLDMEAPDI